MNAAGAPRWGATSRVGRLTTTTTKYGLSLVNWTLLETIFKLFFCDGDADFVIVAEIPNRELVRGMRNNALATGSVVSLKNFLEVDLAAVTASQRNARDTFKPITT